MPDEAQPNSDLFSAVAAVAAPAPVVAPVAPPPAPPVHPSMELLFASLIEKHFPALEAGGVEAHQPLRAFLRELIDLKS